MSNLVELKREINVVGKVKNIDRVREGEAKKSGKKYLAYTMYVAVENKKTGTVDDIRVDFFAMDGSAPFKSISKFLEEGKTVANTSDEEADVVTIAGRLELEEYVNKEGKHVVFNKLQGAFIHRLDTEEKHRAVANVETVITDITDKLDEDDLPTGEKVLSGFTVGYNDEVIVINDAIVPKVLADNFVKIYKVGQTAKLTYQFINRALDVEEEEVEDDAPVAAFGAVAEIETGKKFRSFDKRTLVVGGLQPYDEDLALTADEIEQAKKIRQEKEADVVNKTYDVPAPPKKEEPSQNQAFGGSDIPDF